MSGARSDPMGRSTGYCGPDVVPELRKRFGQLLHRTIEPATADLWSYKLFCDNAYADYRLIDVTAVCRLYAAPSLNLVPVCTP